MTCFCCTQPLVRASDIPDARWLRQGDLWCVRCELVVWREQLVDGWPAERCPCSRHRDRGTKGGS